MVIDVLSIVKLESLEKEFLYLLEKNKSNRLPYHNLNHTLTVTKNVYEGAMYEGVKIHIRRNLIIAALFHDFNHSGGLLSDKENVEISISGFSDFVRINGGYTDDDIFNVIDIIKATEYPYVIPTNKLTIEQSIIRDADIMQIFESDRMSQVVYGLAQEFGVKIDSDFVSKQKAFVSSIIPITKWGQWKWKYTEYISFLDLLGDILLHEK
jgi:hypothetical protein